MGYNEDIVTAATGDSDNSPASTAFVQQELDAMKKWPYIDVRASSTQNISHNVVTVVNFTVKDVDAGGDFDLTTDKFTVPENGIYLVTATLYWVQAAPSVTGEYIALLYDGTSAIASQWNQTNPRESNVVRQDVTVMRAFSTSDTISLKAYQNTGGARTAHSTSATNTTRMQIRKIGELP